MGTPVNGISDGVRGSHQRAVDLFNKPLQETARIDKGLSDEFVKAVVAVEVQEQPAPG